MLLAFLQKRILILFVCMVLGSMVAASDLDCENTDYTDKSAGELCSCALKLKWSNPREGVKKAKAGMVKAGEDRKLTGLCYTALGANYISLFHLDSAQSSLKEGLVVYTELDDVHKQVDCLSLLGLSFYYKQELAEAEKYYRRSMELARAHDYERSLPESVNNLGLVFFSWHKYDSAMVYFQEALRLKRKMNKTKSIPSSLSNIGAVAVKMGLLEEALGYYRESLSLEQEERGRAGSYNNISNVFDELGQYDSAVIYLKKALEIYERNDNKREKAKVYYNLGHNYFKNLDLPELAVKYYEQAAVLFKELGLYNEAHEVYTSLGEVFLALELPGNSGKYLDSAAQIDSKVNSVESVYRYFMIRSEQLEKDGRPTEALASYKKFVTMRDSMNFEKQRAHVSELEAAYESERKEQEMELLHKSRKIDDLSHQLYLAVIIAAFVLLIVSFVYYLIRMKKERALRAAQQKLHDSHQHLMREKYKNLQLEKEKLDNDLEGRKQELVNQALILVEKNNLFEELRDDFKQLAKRVDHPMLKLELDKLIQDYMYKINVQGRNNFEERAEPYLMDFYQKLEHQVDGLTESEKRLASLLRSDLTSKEIATVLGIEPKSVDMRRYRLRKKLEISSEESLTEFFKSL